MDFEAHPPRITADIGRGDMINDNLTDISHNISSDKSGQRPAHIDA